MADREYKCRCCGKLIAYTQMVLHGSICYACIEESRSERDYDDR